VSPPHLGYLNNPPRTNRLRQSERTSQLPILNRTVRGLAPGYLNPSALRFADWGARAWYRVVMDASKIWSAEELEKMSPNERQSIVRAGFETDLSRVSPELLERTRRKIEAHISANQEAATPER
jgi:hypothetical protein